MALAAVGLLVVSTASASASAASGAWSRPFTVAGPYEADLLAPQIAFSPAGAAAVGFGVFNEDFPSDSRAVISTRAADGAIGGPRRVPSAEELLSLGFDGSALELLTGDAPAGITCCYSAGTVTFARGRFTHRQTLLDSLDGAALGGLVGLPHTRMLGSVETAAGVWVAQSPALGRFRSSRRLTKSTSAPQALAVAALRHGRSAVAWTEASAADPNVPAGAIFLATGTAQHAPTAAHLALTAPAGHGIDELALAGGATGPTAAWIDSWYDSAGNYHSQAAVAQLKGRPVARTFPVARQLASGLSLAVNAADDQVLAWKTCDELASCTVWAVGRAAGRSFGTPQLLGSVDPGEAPAAAVAPDGRALVAWVTGGQVRVAGRPSTHSRFGAPATLSRATYGSSVEVAFGPADQALVAWIEGIAKPRLMGAFRG